MTQPHNRDLMAQALQPVYGPEGNLSDWEWEHWLDSGFESSGPGDKHGWYVSQGAIGTHYGDVERTYWGDLYSFGAVSHLLTEDGNRLVTEDGDPLKA